ncbi:MAG: transposase [Chloroflexi bacterium]|nr:transposase [Chloroflexota bacterium]
MPTGDFLIDLYWRVDEALGTIPPHPQACLAASEVVTLGLLFALKGVGNRAVSRWVDQNWRSLFPRLPHRTRLFRRFKTHRGWTGQFLASPTLLGVIDTDGSERLHPIREGRSPRQIGTKGRSNHRWIVGGKLCLLLTQWGLIVGWDGATANVHDRHFQGLVAGVQHTTVVLADANFHRAAGDPPNLKICPRGAWNDRMLIETVRSMLTLICHFKKVMHRGWDYFCARLAYTMAAFNLPVQWHGPQPDEDGFIPLSIAQFSL